MADGGDSHPMGDEIMMPESSTPDPEASYSPKIMLREKSADERRESARRSYFVGVYIESDQDAREQFGLSGNISQGGLFVVTSSPPPLGAIVELEFLLDEAGTSLVVEGEVRWVRQRWDPDNNESPGFGVEFVELNDNQRNELHRLLSQLDSAGAPRSVD